MRGSSQLKYIALSALFIFATVNFTRTTLEILKSSKRLDELKNEVSGLEKSKDGLEKSVSYMQSNDYVEERARDDLNLIKPGEKVYVVEGDNLKAKDSKSSGVLAHFSERLDKNKAVKDSNAYQWYRLFFD